MKMVFAPFLENYHRAYIYNVLITFSEDNTPIDFGFTRSNVKDTIVTFVKTK